MIYERFNMLQDGSTLWHVSDPGAAVPHRGQDVRRQGAKRYSGLPPGPGTGSFPSGFAGSVPSAA